MFIPAFKELDGKPNELTTDIGSTWIKERYVGVTTEQLAEKTKQVYGGLKPSSGDLLNKYLYPLINQGSPLLRYKLETPYDYPISRLKLYYDLSSLKENADYEEAKLHWEQDLNDIRIDPEVKPK